MVPLDFLIEKFKLLDNRLIRIMEASGAEVFTAQLANDILEKAGLSARAVECELITEELRDQLWDAAVKIGLVNG